MTYELIFRPPRDHRPAAARSPQLQQPQVDERDRTQPGGNGRGGLGSGTDEATGVIDVEAVEAKGVAFISNGFDGGAASVGDEDTVR